MDPGRPRVYDHVDRVCWMQVVNLVQASGGRAVSRCLLAGKVMEALLSRLPASDGSTGAVTLVADFRVPGVRLRLWVTFLPAQS